MSLYTIYADGGAKPNPGHAGGGALIMRDNVVIETMGIYIGENETSNRAEYAGLIQGLEEVRKHSPKQLRVRMDSKLVCKQMEGWWACKHPGLKPLLEKALKLTKELEGSGCGIFFEWVPRELNKAADALASRAVKTRRPFWMTMDDLRLKPMVMIKPPLRLLNEK
jgi:ribonuclease HI